jgi:hypothetical protein
MSSSFDFLQPSARRAAEAFDAVQRQRVKHGLRCGARHHVLSGLAFRRGSVTA